MPNKKLSPSFYVQSQASLDSLKQLEQELERCLEQDEGQNSVYELINRLTDNVTDLHYKWIFHEYIRIPNHASDVFTENIQPLIDKCLKARVRIQFHHDDIRQEILLKLLKANPVFPKYIRGYLSSMVRHGIRDFYNREQRHALNQTLYPNSEVGRLHACIGDERIVSNFIDYIAKTRLPEKKKRFFRYLIENDGLSRKEIMAKYAIGKTTYDRYSQSLRVLVKQYCDKNLPW